MKRSVVMVTSNAVKKTTNCSAPTRATLSQTAGLDSLTPMKKDEDGGQDCYRDHVDHVAA